MIIDFTVYKTPRVPAHAIPLQSTLMTFKAHTLFSGGPLPILWTEADTQ